MGGRQTPRNGVLAQYFEFVRKMTGSESNAIQRTCGAAALLVPLGVLALASLMVVHHVENVDVRALLGVVGGGGLCGVGVAVRRTIRRRLAGHARTSDAGGVVTSTRE